MILREHPGASGKGGVVTVASHQAEGLQDTADLTVDLHPHINELPANTEQGS
jgi:hypothetical protein